MPYHLSPDTADLFHNRAKLHILDVGCGPAQNRAFFQGHGHTYVGLDMLTPQADVRGDAMMLPFEPESFDAVITVAMLQYTWNPYQVMCEANRVLNPGGTFTGTTAFLEPWSSGGLAQLTPGGVVELLQRAGFEVEYVWPGSHACEAIHGCAFRPVVRLGRCVGQAERIMHVIWWCMMNVVRRLTRRAPKDRLTSLLEFAGSVNFHARKAARPERASRVRSSWRHTDVASPDR